MKHWVTFDLSTVFFWQRKLIKPFTCKSIGKTFFSFSNDYPQLGSSRWGGLRLILRRRQICKNCISQKIENKYLLHEIHWLKTGYSDVFYVYVCLSVCLSSNLCMFVGVSLFSHLYCIVIQYQLIITVLKICWKIKKQRCSIGFQRQWMICTVKTNGINQMYFTAW